MRHMWTELLKEIGRTMVAVFLSEAQTNTNSASWIISNYHQKKSVKYFLKTASVKTPKSGTPDLLARACQKLQTGSLEEDLTIIYFEGWLHISISCRDDQPRTGFSYLIILQPGTSNYYCKSSSST